MSSWGEGTFIQLFSSSLLTAHPELASNTPLRPQCIHQVCVCVCTKDSNKSQDDMYCAFIPSLFLFLPVWLQCPVYACVCVHFTFLWWGCMSVQVE